MEKVESVCWADVTDPNRPHTYVVQISIPGAQEKVNSLKTQLLEEGWTLQATGVDTLRHRSIILLRKRFKSKTEWKTYHKKRLAWSKLLSQ